MSRFYISLALLVVLFACALAAEHQDQQSNLEREAGLGDNTHIRERRWPGMWGMGMMRPWGMGYGMGMYGMGYPGMMGFGWGR